MSGISAVILAHISTHPEGLTSTELIELVFGGRGDNHGAIHNALRRMRINGTVAYSRQTLGHQGRFFLPGKVTRHPLDCAMAAWDVTASEMLREEYAQASATS